MLNEVPGLFVRSQSRKNKKGEITMERRKEYAEDDIIVCPKCDSDDVDYSEAPGWGKCQSCGLEFEVKTVLIWNE
jgi:transcription elongation factor Elf1